jgi:hypothetical protein
MIYSASYHECSLEYIRLNLHNPKDGSLITNDVALAGADDVDAAVLAERRHSPLSIPSHHKLVKILYSSLLHCLRSMLMHLETYLASHLANPNGSPSTKSAVERTRSDTMQDGLTNSPGSLSPREMDS